MLSTENAARMCPICGEDTSVYETREREDGVAMRRRRCPKCGTKVETMEVFVRIIPRKKSRKH